MSAATMFCILLAVAAIASARPTNFWNSMQKNTWTRVQQSPQCSVAQTGSSICQSALLVNKLPNGGRKHSYVTICPGRGGVCINTLLPRCCRERSELENSNLECVHTTSLSVSQRNVEVKIFRNNKGEHCYHVDDPNIGLCCQKVEPFLECEPRNPPSPVCVPKRDIYFVVDSTDSIDDPIFCTFGYVLQLIVAAINPRGVNGARVAAILFEYDSGGTNYKPKFLFNLDDQCATIVNDNIQKLVYEYYGVKHLGLIDRNTLTYPNVRAPTTIPFSALTLAAKTAESISSRPSSVITLTDGETDQNVNYVINRLKKVSDPLIGAGIGMDVNEDILLKLSSNSSTVVYEPNRNNVINFAKGIVETMRDTAALCPAEANKIIGALNSVQEMKNLENYCEKCMWTAKDQRNGETQNYCQTHTPECGAQSFMTVQSVGDKWKAMDTGQNLEMQAFEDTKPASVAYRDRDKQMLEERILEVVEEVIKNKVHK